MADLVQHIRRVSASPVAAPDIRLAVFRAIYTKANAELQAQALALGQPTYLTTEECETAAGNICGQIARSRGLWQGVAWSRSPPGHPYSIL